MRKLRIWKSFKKKGQYLSEIRIFKDIKEIVEGYNEKIRKLNRKCEKIC